MGADLITYIVVGKPSIKKTTAEIKQYWKENADFLRLNESTEEISVASEFKEGFENVADFTKFVRDFTNFWNDGGPRDTNSRLLGEGKNERQIVVAGDMSWGDEPDGAGYQMFKRVYENELGEFFGLE